MARDEPARGPISTRILLLWAIWLPYLAYPISTLLAAHPSPARLFGTLAPAGVFVAIYLWTAWRFLAGGDASRSSPAGSPVPDWLPLAALTALSLALSLGAGKEWLQLFIYTCAIVGVCLPLRAAAPALAGLVLLTLALGLIEHVDWPGIGQTSFVQIVTGVCVMGLVWLVGTNRALRLAREEIARLAVSEERSRFARDLHDLLGHSLSLIALKSELAGRLATVAPERAANEMRDVEAVARTALQEVRVAVAGYRQPTLDSELRGAQEILAAAGISCTCEGEIGTLPAGVEAALSWTVREGVTNVIRHSRARRCTIQLTRDAGQAGVTLIDDGSAIPAPAARGGHGLTGLAERVQAIGGRCAAQALPGGFRLSVTVPLVHDAGRGAKG